MAFFNLPCKEYEVIMASYNYIVLFAFTTMYIYLTAKKYSRHCPSGFSHEVQQLYLDQVVLPSSHLYGAAKAPLRHKHIVGIVCLGRFINRHELMLGLSSFVCKASLIICFAWLNRMERIGMHNVISHPIKSSVSAPFRENV